MDRKPQFAFSDIKEDTNSFFYSVFTQPSGEENGLSEVLKI
jgi:hypothetical protein